MNGKFCNMGLKKNYHEENIYGVFIDVENSPCENRCSFE